MGGNVRCLGGTCGNVGPKLEALIFPGKSGAIVPICPGRLEALFLHILDPNYSSFYLKCPRKYQKAYNSDMFFTVLQICTSLPLKLWRKS